MSFLSEEPDELEKAKRRWHWQDAARMADKFNAHLPYAAYQLFDRMLAYDLIHSCDQPFMNDALFRELSEHASRKL